MTEPFPLLPVRPAAELERWLRRERGVPWGDSEVARQVSSVIAAVRDHGDEALVGFTARWDGVRLEPEQLRVPDGVAEAAWQALGAAEREALQRLREWLEAFHRRQIPTDLRYDDGAGNRLGQLCLPLRRVGVYVPGGRAAYPSTVLMAAVPARLAGVREIVLASPPMRDGELSPWVLAAAWEAGVTEIYRVGGAQAIAALAYGTPSIRPVDKIVGPGNVYVTAAKAQVAHVVGIDGLAGPTEIVLVAARGNPPSPEIRPEWLALDMLAQAEHDPHVLAVLLTPEEDLARAVAVALAEYGMRQERQAIARQSLSRQGGIFLVRDLAEAMRLANRLAPEHLSLQIPQAEEWLPQVENAGAVFVGPHAPVAAGDYAAGTNHVLPTGGTARFASGLSVEQFLRRVNYFLGTRRGAAAWAAVGARLAEAEGLPAHALSLRARLEEVAP